MKDGTIHPRDAKMALAREITAAFYSDDAAAKAEESFVRTFQQKDIPTEMPEYALQPGQTVLDVIVTAGLAASRGEGRRLVDQKGVKLDGEVLSDALAAFPHPGVLQVGKRHFLRVK